LKRQVKAEQERLLKARAELGSAPASSGLRERRDIELEIAKLEGMLKAFLESADDPVEAPDRPVVTADEEVLKLAQRFGLVSLESVNIDAQAHMNLRKGGESTVFGDVTKGERLRLRIATAVALLRIGKKLGIGRHPGLLIIDSPGAEETDQPNLEAFLQELRSIADDEVGLQVFVSSSKAKEVTAVLKAENCCVAAKGKYLW
jgi:hypothetical protein